MPKSRYGMKKGLKPVIANNDGDHPDDDDTGRRNWNGHVSTAGLNEDTGDRNKIKLDKIS